MPVSVNVRTGALAQGAPERARSESDDHQGDAEFQPVGDTLRDGDPQGQYKDTRHDERRRVPRAPQRADQHRAREFPLFTDNGRDGDDVINFGGVL